MSVATRAASDTRRVKSWLHFPLRRIAGNASLQEGVAKFVWVAVPLEYYVLTSIAGGFTRDEYLAVAMDALLSVLGVLGISLAIGCIPLGAPSYGERVRRWAVSLIVTWAASLLLLAASYFLATSYFSVSSGRDLLAEIVCGSSDDRPGLLRCARYPQITDPETFVIYLCYALLASLLILIAAWIFGKEPEEPRPNGPNIFAVALFSSLIMTVFHGLTKM